MYTFNNAEHLKVSLLKNHKIILKKVLNAWFYIFELKSSSEQDFLSVKKNFTIFIFRL